MRYVNTAKSSILFSRHTYTIIQFNESGEGGGIIFYDLGKIYDFSGRKLLILIAFSVSTKLKVDSVMINHSVRWVFKSHLENLCHQKT